MKQYETYEQARIDNPKSGICKLICEGFTTESEIARGNFGQYSFTYCKASDYCEMTLQEFLERGHLLVNGDIIITCLDNVAVMGVNDFEIENFNLKHESDSKTFILRAAALENQMNIDKLETQTVEELIEGPQQDEVWRCVLLPRQYVIYLYKSHEGWDTDWVNRELVEGQEIKPIQKLYTRCEVEDMIRHPNDGGWKKGDAVYLSNPEGFALQYGHKDMDRVHECVALLPDENAMVVRCGFGLGVFSLKMCSKPETPEAKEKRERLEAAYDLYLIDFEKSGRESFNYNQFCKDDYMRDFWLTIVDKTNYRKG